MPPASTQFALGPVGVAAIPEFDSGDDLIDVVELDEVLVPARPGLHQVRVRARGRRLGHDQSVVKEKPVEGYQIKLQPLE